MTDPGASERHTPKAESSSADAREELIAGRQRALDAERQDEHERATALIRDAVAAFREAGIAPYALRARPWSGGNSIRTGLVGWYLTKDRSVGVDEDGNYYVLQVAGGLVSRLRGETPSPYPAPMVVGRGARDGETVDLPDLLRTRLEDPVQP
ncbi:MAG: hypothetical protein Q4G40_05205 [Brachybacterium sp.]|nr:hypothetical protein [Brachybacterium sp.]